jgi:hypothetical protein
MASCCSSIKMDFSRSCAALSCSILTFLAASSDLFSASLSFSLRSLSFAACSCCSRALRAASLERSSACLAAGRLYSSTYATPRFMLRPSTARTAIDLSIAKRRCSSTCRIHQRMPCPSTVRLAIDPSTPRRL